MRIIPTLAFWGLAAGLAATPALAQVAGTYSGTSADGHTVSFVVATDSATGNLEITSASVGFTGTCHNGSSTDIGVGWAPNVDITNGKVTQTAAFTDFWLKFALKFSADGSTATGTESGVAPVLIYNSNNLPTTASPCKSASQAMTLSLQSSSTVAPQYPTGHSVQVYRSTR